MAQFTLPKNSKVTEGKTWAYPSGAHAWVNRGTEPCRIAFILVDAKEP